MSLVPGPSMSGTKPPRTSTGFGDHRIRRRVDRVASPAWGGIDFLRRGRSVMGSVSSFPARPDRTAASFRPDCGDRAWFRFSFKWTDAKTGEAHMQAGMQVYRTEGGKLAETWIAYLPLGSVWTDGIAQPHWTSHRPSSSGTGREPLWSRGVYSFLRNPHNRGLSAVPVYQFLLDDGKPEVGRTGPSTRTAP